MMNNEHVVDCDIDGHGHGYLKHNKDGCSISERHPTSHKQFQNVNM